MPHYQNSVIYKLKHNEDYDDTNIYVGSTTNFKNRKNQHKNACYNEKNKNYNMFIYQYIRDNGGWEQWVMIPIEQQPCNSKKELEIRERYHIDLLRPSLNKQLPTRTKKEYYDTNKEKLLEKHKEYYETNKEKLFEKHKEYYKNWREANKEKSKQYREANKEILNEKKKEKAVCDHCGCEIRKYGLKTHQKTKKCIESQKDNVAR